MMMVKDTTGQVSVSTDDSFAEADGASPSSGPGTTHQAHEEPLMKSTAARHKLKFTSSRTKLWRNLSRKQRSSSHGSFKMANSSMTDELLIDDSNVILQDSVQLTNCLQTRQRYLFLLSNVLVLAKQKSPANFTVKDEIRLCEIWLSDCVDQVSEVVCDRERSFVIGWPTVNMVATFASIHIRDVWLSKLQQQIAEEKAQEWPPNVVIKIINASQAFSVVKSMLVQNCESAKDIVMRCVQEMHIPSASVNDFQFWVQSEKENHPYPLIGHEFPYAIQMNYIHTKQGSSDSTDVSLHDGLRFQIVPKQTKSKLSMKLSLDETRRCPKKTSKIVRLFKKSSRSVDVGNIFGRHLSDLFDGGALCAPVMDILSHLFVHGPSAVDIFRKSAIVSRCHEVKQHLDGGDKVDFNDVHVGVSAALLKELLRCLPNCLLLCELYSKWIKISTVIDNQHLANDRLKSLVQVLPPSHLIFLRYLMCILYRISLRSDHNGMTAYSLSICISPSLLWPRSSYGAAISQVNDAKKLNAVVEHMIECTDEIFGPDCLHVFDHLIPERNQPRDVSENVGQGANSSLDIVKEESMADDGVEQDIDVTCSASDLGHQSPDVTPTSTRYDSGLATSNSLSYNDFVLMTALGDCSPSAETYSGSDLEPASSLVTPNTSVNCVSRMDTRKCRFEDVSGWFHLAIEDDTHLESPIRDSYPAGGEVCESLPETYLSGANLSAEFHSETEQVSVGMLRSLNTSNTELSDEMQTLVGAKPANVDSKVLDRSSSLDESQTVGLTLKQDVVKIDQGSFEMESGLSTVGSEANRLSRLNLRSVCSSGDLGDPSSETVSSICQSLLSAALPKQTLSSASISCDVPDSQHSSSRCEEKNVLVTVTEVEQKAHLPEQEVKRDKILCNPRSFKGILSRERTNSCDNSSAVESKSSSLNLRRGMTKCGSDIFPKYFMEGLHCTFGEVMVYNGSEEEERLTGKSRGIGQSKAASTTTCGLLETPWHAMVRPPHSLSKGHHFNSFCHPVAPCIINSGHRVRPARPPSYAEAVAAKALQGSSVGSPGSGQNVAGFASHSSLVMEGHPVPSIGCTDRNEEARVPTLPSVRSIECARNPIVPGSVVTCGLISRALQSVSSVAGMGSSTTVQSIPSTGTGSKPISSVSTNSETVASFEHARTARLCGEHKGEPLSIQNSDMPNELCVFDVLPNEPSIGSVVVTSDYITRSVNSLSQACSNVRSENNRTGVCALTAKQRLDQKVRVRKRRQRSTDPKLHSSRAFGRGIGRSKSDSSEILEKKRHEYNSDEDKENVLVPSNSFLKRKLAAMKQASKEEELRNASHCSKCTVPCHLSMVSEESSTYANERESACSPRDMKKKKSLLFECHDLQNEEAFHSSSLNGLELTDSLQHEMEALRKDEFCKERIEREPPPYSKTVFVSQNMSFNRRYCPSESFNISSQQDDESSVRKSSSSASAPSSARHPYLFRAAKLPVPDAIKVNWSVSKLKQAYDDQSDSRPDAVACLPRMIALHDLPYFV